MSLLDNNLIDKIDEIVDFRNGIEEILSRYINPGTVKFIVMEDVSIYRHCRSKDNILREILGKDKILVNLHTDKVKPKGCNIYIKLKEHKLRRMPKIRRRVGKNISDLWHTF